MQASDTVGELLTLQEIDLEILRIEDELERLDEEVTGLRETVETLETRVGGIRAEARKAEARVDRHRRAVEAGRATLKRLESRSASVVNEQQYLALRSESDTARRNLRGAEDSQLDAMLEVESAREALTEARAELELAAAALAERSAAAADLRATLEGELRIRGADRKHQEDRLDGRALKLYKTAGGGGRRSALAELTADGVCGRCFTSVPKQRQAEIRTRRSLAMCEGCGIILYPVSPGG